MAGNANGPFARLSKENAELRKENERLRELIVQLEQKIGDSAGSGWRSNTTHHVPGIGWVEPQ